MYNTQLETFIWMADVGSFNKAAEQSYITPMAAIKQMNLLEKSLDVYHGTLQYCHDVELLRTRNICFHKEC